MISRYLETSLNNLSRVVADLSDRLRSIERHRSNQTSEESSADTLAESSVISRLARYFIGAVTFSSSVIFSGLTASRPLKLNSSKTVTSVTIDLSSSDDISSVLTVANGGTGLSTISANQVMLGNGTSAIITKVGVDGSLVLTLSTSTLNYKDHAGTNQSMTVVNDVTLTSNYFDKGVRTL